MAWPDVKLLHIVPLGAALVPLLFPLLESSVRKLAVSMPTTPYEDKKKGLWVSEIYDGYKPNGRPNRSRVTAKSKNECIRKAQDRYKQMVNGEYRPGRTPSVEGWMNEWLTNIAPSHRTYNVMQNYRSFSRKHIVPAIGKRKLDNLTPADIRQMHTEIKDKGLSDRMVQQVHALLARALKDAVREGVIPKSPCDMMDRPQAVMQEAKSLSVVESKAVLRQAVAQDDVMSTRWITGLLTGLRQGEALGLTWDRLDLTAGTMRIDRQLDTAPVTHGCGQERGGEWPCGARWASYCDTPIIDDSGPEKIDHIVRSFVWRSPKTESSTRIVPLPKVLVDALILHRNSTWVPNRWGLVWTQTNGLPVGERTDSNRWKQLLQDAGVSPVKLHGARHTTVSLLLDLGVDPEIIRRIVGHSTIAATRGYMHADQSTLRSALESLSRELE